MRNEGHRMKKLKNEAGLIKEAIRQGSIYVKERGAGEIEDSDPAKLKIEFIYRLLVHDGIIQPLPHDKLDALNMRHRLAMWISKKLPEGHELLK